MLTSKQRAFLRSLAVDEETILMVGKGGMSDQVTKQADDALTARELLKGKVLETAGVSSREIAEQLALETHSEVVQVIGAKFVLFRRSSFQKPRKESVDENRYVWREFQSHTHRTFNAGTGFCQRIIS